MSRWLSRYHCGRPRIVTDCSVGMYPVKIRYIRVMRREWSRRRSKNGLADSRSHLAPCRDEQYRSRVAHGPVNQVSPIRHRSCHLWSGAPPGNMPTSTCR